MAVQVQQLLVARAFFFSAVNTGNAQRFRLARGPLLAFTTNRGAECVWGTCKEYRSYRGLGSANGSCMCIKPSIKYRKCCTTMCSKASYDVLVLCAW